MRRRTTGLSVLATLLVGGAVGMVALQGGLGTTGGDSALVRRLLAFVAPEEESGARDMRGDVLTANGTGQQRQQHLPHGTIEGALLPSNRASPAYLQQYAREHDERRLVDAIRSCSAAQAPATSAAAPGNTAAPERLTDNLRTVMREGRDLSLRELGQPVALRLDGEQYPERRLRLHVDAGDGICRLVVDQGTVQVDGVSVPQGSACAVSSGAEVVWTGEAGIRLEDPRRTDVPNGAG